VFKEIKEQSCKKNMAMKFNNHWQQIILSIMQVKTAFPKNVQYGCKAGAKIQIWLV
jgi:hypothetical protein